MRFIHIAIILFLTGAVAWGQINIDVVYPRPTPDGSPPVVPKVDSTFIFGSVDPPVSQVLVNGIEAELYRNGAFMAFVPLDWETMTFEIRAGTGDNLVVRTIPFTLPQPETPVRLDCPLPVKLMVTDPHAVMRYSDNLGVYYMFPARGAICWANMISENFFGVRLNGNNGNIWVEEKYVTPLFDEILPGEIPPEIRRVYSLEVEDGLSEVRIIVPCGNHPLHKITELNEFVALKLQLFGVESHIDMIRHTSEYIRHIRWEQETGGTLSLTVFLNGPRLWGYAAEIDYLGDFILHISKPPRKLSVKGLRIALDPGHGGEDFGAIGPTRLTEKEANLSIARKTAKLLERKGAEVLMTRTDDSFTALYDRMDTANEWGADLFISIHNNALPDGENPFLRTGAGVYFYHPKSIDLARFILKRLLQKTGQANDGLYYNNLAVPRTTYMPSVLIEAAYIINPEEEILLRNDKFQKKIAEGIYLGIKDFMKAVKKETGNEKKFGLRYGTGFFNFGAEPTILKPSTKKSIKGQTWKPST